MSEIIKIHDLPGLGRYGKALKDYGNNIEAAAKETERQFITKTEESVSDAVLAFFEKMNTLQTQVFHQAPEIIKNYGANVQFFESTVSGLGFEVKAWTWDEGKNDVTQKLKVDQVDKIKEVMKSLQSLLDSATEKVSFPEVNLTKRYLESAQSEQDSLAENRTGTHVGIEAAHDLFSTNLSEVIKNLDALTTVITHAKAAMLLSPTTVFGAIQSGMLTRETMFYIDNIENATDAKAVEAALSGHPELLMQMDTNSISEGTYPSLASIMSEWWEREDVEVLNRYLDSFTNADSAKVGDFSQKMMIGGMKASIILEGKMQKMFSDGVTLDSPALVAKEKQLNALNGFNGLMKSVQVLEVGISRESLKNPGNAEGQEYRYRYHKRNLSLAFDNGLGKLTLKTISFDAIQPVSDNQRDRTFELVKNAPKDQLLGMYRKEETFISGTEPATFGVRGIEYNKAMQAYEQERKEAVKKFIANVVIMTADAATTMIAPEAYLANKVFQSVARLEGFKGVQNSYKLYKRVDGSDSSTLKEKVKAGSVGGVADSFNAIFDWMKSLDEINLKEKTDKNRRLQDYTGQGQWYLKKGGDIINHDSTIYRDFNAGLRQRELDKNGVTGFMESRHVPKDDIKQTIDAKVDLYNDSVKEEDKISDQVRKYAKGEEVFIKDKFTKDKKRLTLEKMTPKQLKEFEDLIGTLGNKSASQFGEYLDGTFGK